MPGTLEGRRALVTGATGGIGDAVCHALSTEGAAILATGRDEARLEKLAKRLDGLVGVPADLTSRTDIDRLADGAAGVEIVVHAAGIYSRSVEVTDLELQFHVNVAAPFMLTRLLLPKLTDVVFVNSSQGLDASRDLGAYAASKHALRAVADALRAEVNERGTRVLSLYAGRTATPLQERIFELEGRIYRPELLMQPEDVADVIVSALKLPRTAEMTSVAMRPLCKS